MLRHDVPPPTRGLPLQTPTYQYPNIASCILQVDASQTRSYGGSGLGLAISKRLCEAMGGRMWAESPGPGAGSTFAWTIAVRVPKQVMQTRRRSSMLLTATAKKEPTSHLLDISSTYGSSWSGAVDSDDVASVISSDAGTFLSGAWYSGSADISNMNS